MTREEINDVNDDDINTMCILFNALINDLCNQCRHNDAEEMEGIRDRLIKRLLEQEPKWIPVSERLPEVGSEVLVCFDFKGKRSVYISDFYSDGEFHGLDDEYLTPEGRKCRKAVAWMPLPPSYQGE